MNTELKRITTHDLSFWTDPAAAEAGIFTAFSERGGGVSTGPYDSLNLGLAVGDDPTSVTENRERLCEAAGLGRRAVRQLPLVTQVHGTRVVVIDSSESAPSEVDSSGTEADGLVTATPGQPLLLCFADCVPVMLWATTPRPCIAVLHSGWKGCLHNIAGAGVDALTHQYGVAPSDLHALIGPYIGAESFVVSEDLWLQFARAFPTIEGRQIRGSDGRLCVRFDLAETVRAALVQAGVQQGRMSSLGQSTVLCANRFFSYRASGGVCGRMGALACVAH
ncbi:MAG: polyphenol oxidase family protein [Actinomycetes bacterium]|jgi:YfiH family protein|nr:polyphenol oxidase family protein [Actinomycetes bacterium]